MEAAASPESAFPMRAVELHGQRMWERHSVVRTLAFMQRHGLNTLVLHESDLVHQVVYPRAYFDPYALWSDLPSRRGENAIFNKRAYLTHLLGLAADAGVAVWVNVKEIGFSDEVLAIHPEVVKDGIFCPSEPFWTEYIGHKTHELFTDFPLLAGMIVSFGSQESRASRVQNRCRCSLCASEPLSDWYARLIATLHTPISRHGKQLAVRDFAYKPQDHARLVEAVDRSPQDVIFCIKAMPHDFYLGFPDNPAIGRLARIQWIEYDVLGQFFGWGVMPCLVLDDLRPRMAHWRACGVQGAIFRIEWERINDLDCLDTLNEINLVAAAAWAAGHDIDAEEACTRWLVEHGHAASQAHWLAAVLARTMPVVQHAAYINGFVSADNSMLPRSIERAWWGMEVRDSLTPWAPDRAGDLSLDRVRAATYVREKDDALAAARALVAFIDQSEEIAEGTASPGDSLRALVAFEFRHFEIWIEGLCLCAKVCIHSRWLGESTSDAKPEDLQSLQRWLAQLQDYVERVQRLADDHSIPHQRVMLFDPRRALDILLDGRAAAARIQRLAESPPDARPIS
jgi:hypothetical protein